MKSSAIEIRIGPMRGKTSRTTRNLVRRGKRRHAMGDKGKKAKDKDQKQRIKEHDKKAKGKMAKQAKGPTQFG